jgi:MoaA/NifB/PqqE/SkfB family radical SAM enzyme
MADPTLLEAATTGGPLPPIVPQQRAALPKVVYVELADYCNLNCMFCGRGAYVNATGDVGGFIDVESLRKLEQPLAAAQYLGLSGRIGEPLIHPRLEYILRWVYEINPNILLRITTNGTALSRKMAALLAGHLDFLAISLNASNAEAYFREMRPVGQRGVDPTAWWGNLIRRITEFIAALPASDRGRVRIIVPVQRDNIDDVFDFVELVSSMGCSHAIITPMQVHDDSKVDMSVFWIKDKYNDVMDEAAALGARLGLRVEAARFYTNPKLDNVNLETLCREPVEAAYLNMERFGGVAPCCQWIEELIPADIYTDDNAFERFWNNDIYRRLRLRRDFKSCKVCGITRAFDEVSFHFTPLLKKNLVASRRCAEAEAEIEYPDSELVRVCRSLSLDLRSLRRTLLKLGVPVERLDAIRRDGLAAVPEIDRACWQAFLATDSPAGEVDVALGGCFPGLGWFEPDNDPAARVSARWMGGARAASVFARVVPGYAYDIRLTAHHLRSLEMANGLGLEVCEQPLEVQRCVQNDGTTLLTAAVPERITRSFGGRLRFAVIYNDAHGHEGWVSFSRLEAIRRLECVTAKRWLGQRWRMRPRSSHVSARRVIPSQFVGFLSLRRLRSWRQRSTT